MALTEITDHWTETVSDFILEQYRDASNWKAILKAVIDEYSDIEGEIWKLAPILDFKCRVKGERPSGALLDFVAALKNVYRMQGETDEALYERFLVAVSEDNAGTPNNVIYNAAILSGDNAPQYMDESDCTFFVYDGPRPDGEGGWEQGGHQLSRAQVRKLAPSGVLGLPGAAIRTCSGKLLANLDGKLVLAVARDENIEREVLLADNLGNIVITPNSVPVRVKLTGPSVPSIPVIETEWNGVPVDAVRIKDLPDGGDVNSYMVRDSDTEGTVKSRAMDKQTLDELWDSTPAEGE
jgi:hypothetical protein